MGRPDREEEVVAEKRLDFSNKRMGVQRVLKIENFIMTGWSEQEAEEVSKCKSVYLWELYSWNYHIQSQETSQRRTKTSGHLSNTNMIRVHALTPNM